MAGGAVRLSQGVAPSSARSCDPNHVDGAMSDDLKLFSGAAALVALFALLSIWQPGFESVAAAQFGAVVGAAAMKMKGD